MSDEEQFQLTNRIEMQISSVEYRVETSTAAESLAIKLALVTIARGSCSMLIKSSTVTPEFCGTFKIPLDRSVIESTVEMSQMLFNRLTKRIAETAERRVRATVEINKTLTLDHEGCLIIDDTIEALIENLTWTFGLR
ncbi:hypothetical protein N8Z70_03200 [Candidatus Puniceispirillum sp.]|nr:hypothetical protein [Alphaproteobacteria bacterium]MDC1294030.1 hypothetical protein [Candidatus Puniceispirillum sp.]